MYDQHPWLNERNIPIDRAEAEAAARAREAAFTLGADAVSGQLNAASNQAQAIEATWNMAAQAEAQRYQAYRQSQINPTPTQPATAEAKNSAAAPEAPEKIEKFLGGVHVTNPPPSRVEQVKPLPKKYQTKPSPTSSSDGSEINSSAASTEDKPPTSAKKIYKPSAWDYIVEFFSLVWIGICSLPMILLAIWAVSLAVYAVIGVVVLIYNIVKIATTGAP